jgi:hypothetical protein
MANFRFLTLETLTEHRSLTLRVVGVMGVAPSNKTLVDSIAFGLVNRAAGNHSVSRNP